MFINDQFEIMRMLRKSSEMRKLVFDQEICGDGAIEVENWAFDLRRFMRSDRNVRM